MKTKPMAQVWEYDSETRNILDHLTGEIICRNGDSVYGRPKHARLIAAAPELLQALADILEISQGGVVMRHETGKPTWSAMDEMTKLAQEAILKATGEA